MILPVFCYNILATAPKQVEEGGDPDGYNHIISHLHRGKCSRLLHLQMAG